VDEPLAEIAFRRLGRAPRFLELFVRREILAAADQVEPGGEAVRLRRRL
jgi:hypothetical protein